MKKLYAVTLGCLVFSSVISAIENAAFSLSSEAYHFVQRLWDKKFDFSCPKNKKSYIRFLTKVIHNPTECMVYGQTYNTEPTITFADIMCIGSLIAKNKKWHLLRKMELEKNQLVVSACQRDKEFDQNTLHILTQQVLITLEEKGEKLSFDEHRAIRDESIREVATVLLTVFEHMQEIHTRIVEAVQTSCEPLSIQEFSAKRGAPALKALFNTVGKKAFLSYLDYLAYCKV